MTRFAILLAAGVSTLSMASAAQAADLIVHQPAAGIVETSSNSWDGFYVGAFAGHLWGTFDDVTDYNARGWLIGLNAGANFSVSNGIVAGVVGDIAWTDAENTAGPHAIDWTGSLRGRLGFDGGAFMPYLTAGLAVAGANVGTNSQTHVGWTAGAGIELAVADNVSIDLLYRYSDYGTAEYGMAKVGLTSHAATVGVNFKF